MDELIFVQPVLELKEKALDYLKEHLDFGETELHGSALLHTMQYENWLQQIKDISSEETVYPG